MHLEPADVIKQRIALQEDHAEFCETRDALTAAIDLLAEHFIELLVTATEQGHPAPTFTMEDKTYFLYAPLVKHARRFSSKVFVAPHETRVLACAQSDCRGEGAGGPLLLFPSSIPDEHRYLRVDSCHGQCFGYDTSYRIRHANQLPLAAFAKSGWDILRQLRSSSWKRLYDVSQGLEHAERLYTALVS